LSLNCNRGKDPESFIHLEEYDDTCPDHPYGCHAQLVAPGQEFHPFPAYKRKPNPGALEAEPYDQLIEDANNQAAKLRVERQAIHDAAYKEGHAF
jgi:hypothetical protein